MQKKKKLLLRVPTPDNRDKVKQKKRIAQL